MMSNDEHNELDPVGGQETPEVVYLNRRKFLAGLGISAGAGAAGYGGYLWWRGSDEEVLSAGEHNRPQKVVQVERALYPADRDETFKYGRPESVEAVVARYTNFYEFSWRKDSWKFVDDFQPEPWTVTIDGLCRNPMKLSMDELLKQYGDAIIERQYRHRCVETWAMCVPWTGIPLANIIKAADPLAKATHVKFVSFNRPDEAANMNNMSQPWPYTEGLTLPEATNALTLLATGMYGHPLLKQHGAPVRLVVPWKYGYKSIKSIERIEFVDAQPNTFWSTLAPHEYPFESNVDPQVPHPRWSQETEWMLGPKTKYPTKKYNGYEKYVADLYA